MLFLIFGYILMMLMMPDLGGFVKEAGSPSLQQELFKTSDTALGEDPCELNPEQK